MHCKAQESRAILAASAPGGGDAFDDYPSAPRRFVRRAPRRIEGDEVADGLGRFGQSSARGLPDVFRAKAVHGEDLHRDGFGFAEQTTDQVLIWSLPAARASDCATTTVERDPVEPLARPRSGRFAGALDRTRFCGACLLSLMFAPMPVHGALPRRRPSTSSG